MRRNVARQRKVIVQQHIAGRLPYGTLCSDRSCSEAAGSWARSAPPRDEEHIKAGVCCGADIKNDRDAH